MRNYQFRLGIYFQVLIVKKPINNYQIQIRNRSSQNHKFSFCTHILRFSVACIPMWPYRFHTSWKLFFGSCPASNQLGKLLLGAYRHMHRGRIGLHRANNFQSIFVSRTLLGSLHYSWGWICCRMGSGAFCLFK